MTISGIIALVIFVVLANVMIHRKKSTPRKLARTEAKRALPPSKRKSASRVIAPSSDLREIPLRVIVTSPIGAHVYELPHDRFSMTLNVTPERRLLVQGDTPEGSIVLLRTTFTGDLFTADDQVRALREVLGDRRAIDAVPDAVHLTHCRVDARRAEMTLHVHAHVQSWGKIIGWLKSLQDFLSLDAGDVDAALTTLLESEQDRPERISQALDYMRDHAPELLEEHASEPHIERLHAQSFLTLMRRWDELAIEHTPGESHLARLNTLMDGEDRSVALQAAIVWHARSVARAPGWRPRTIDESGAAPQDVLFAQALRAMQASEPYQLGRRLEALCDMIMHVEMTPYIRQSRDLMGVEVHPQASHVLEHIRAMAWPFDFDEVEEEIEAPMHDRGFMRRLVLTAMMPDSEDAATRMTRHLLTHATYAMMRSGFEVATRAQRHALSNHAPFFALLGVQHANAETPVLCEFVCATWQDSPHLPACLGTWLEHGKEELRRAVTTQLFTRFAHDEAHIDAVISQLARHPDHPEFFTALGRLPTDHARTRSFLILNPETTPAKRVELMREMRPAESDTALDEIAELALSRLVTSELPLGHQEQRLALELFEHHGGIASLRAIVRLIDHPQWATHQDTVLSSLTTLKRRHPHISQGALSLDERARGELTLSGS